jgi:DNA-binding SARP family transcriptional activator
LSGLEQCETEVRCERQLRLLDGFVVRRDGRELVLPPSAQRLIGFIALRSAPVHRITAACLLSVDSNEDKANARLRTALWRLRQCDPGLVRTTASHVALADTVAVDVQQLSVIASRAIEEPHDVTRADLAAICAPVELLPDWYEDWVLIERERFRVLRLNALEAVCERFARERRFALAVAAGMAAVAAEPLRDSACRALIKAHLAQGNAHEAIRQFHAYRRRLARDLGLEPSPHMLELVRRLHVS